MYATLTCLGLGHDPRLAALAAVICVLAVTATFLAYQRSLQSSGAFRTAWIAVAAVQGGVGVWSTHFLGMLAFRPGMPTRFEFWLTLASLLVAVAGFAVGLAAHRRSASMAARCASGLIVGFATATMHFMGMGAMEIAADEIWRPEVVLLALVAGCGLSALAFGLPASSARARLLARPLILSAAILGLHFTAMGAIVLVPNGASPPTSSIIGHAMLADLVAVTELAVLAVGLAMLMMERAGSNSAFAALAGALNSAPNAIGIFDADRRLTFWNHAFGTALAVLDLTPSRRLTFGEVRAATANAEWLPDSMRARLKTRTRFRPSPEEPFETVFTPDGRWLQIVTSPTPGGGSVVVLNDITSERSARELADHANRTKSEFLANVSHEIRTPLNGVIGMAQVMEMNPLSPDQRERLAAIRAAGEGLMSVLNGVLDLAKIEAGRLELEPHAFDLEQAVHAALAPFAATAEQKGVAFEIQVDPAAAGWRWADASRLRQVLSNLASNAVKFTESGSIRVICDETEVGVRVRVRDTGIGIAAADLPELFEKFSQADGSFSRRYGGTGLGLAISRHLVEAMGGALEVDSEVGRGAEFRFQVPMPRTTAMAEAATSLGPAADDAAAAGAGLRMLAVDDNATNRQVIAAMLRALGVEVTLAEGGAEAVATFDAAPFDLVLMDIQMPGMNGLEATRLIRERQAARGQAPTPILALTANVMTHQVEDYLAAGMNGVVAKPIELPLLMEALEEALGADQPVRVAA